LVLAVEIGLRANERVIENNDPAVVPRRMVLVVCRLRVRMPWKRH
jgi:hypothetical protein